MMRGLVRGIARWQSAIAVGGLAATFLLVPVAAGTLDRAAAEPAKARLEAGEMLEPGDSLRSPDGHFVLTQQADGNLVLVGPNGEAVFDTKTAGNVGAKTVMQDDGNLVVEDVAGHTLFHTNTHENAGAFLQVQPDGNMVVYGHDDQALWSQHAWHGLLPGKFILAPNDYVNARNEACKLVMQGDGNLVLQGRDGKTLFDTRTAGHPGTRAAMQADGNFVVTSGTDQTLFDTKTGGHRGAHLEVQEDCNVVIRAEDTNEPLWNSRTANH